MYLPCSECQERADVHQRINRQGSPYQPWPGLIVLCAVHIQSQKFGRVRFIFETINHNDPEKHLCTNLILLLLLQCEACDGNILWPQVHNGTS